MSMHCLPCKLYPTIGDKNRLLYILARTIAHGVKQVPLLPSSTQQRSVADNTNCAGFNMLKLLQLYNVKLKANSINYAIIYTISHVHIRVSITLITRHNYDIDMTPLQLYTILL